MTTLKPGEADPAFLRDMTPEGRALVRRVQAMAARRGLRMTIRACGHARCRAWSTCQYRRMTTHPTPGAESEAWFCLDCGGEHETHEGDCCCHGHEESDDE